MIKEKTVNDYIDGLSEIFPTIDKRDLKRICNYGWKQIYLFNSYGGDAIILTANFWAHFGHLYYDPIANFKKYIRKLAVKIRVLYKRHKVPWDGYYYMARSARLYQDYLAQINTKGRKKKWFTFEHAYLYKILEECKIRESNKQYIFRVRFPIGIRDTIYRDMLKIDNPELIIERPIQKFKDILISNNDCEFL